MSTASEDEATNEALDTSERLDREMKGYVRWIKIILAAVAFLAFVIFILSRIGA